MFASKRLEDEFMQTILERMTALLREFTGDDSLVLTPDMPLRGEDLGLDSYDLASLLGAAEERFDIVISDRAVMGMLTVGDVMDYLEKHMQKG